MKEFGYSAVKVGELIEHNGVIYEANPHIMYRSSCRNCAFKYHFEACVQINCMKHQRPDKQGITLRAVAFKQKQ